ncbi:hypothetical protein [Fluviicola sp.]|uniref:hypothetical protein n=1 Tax=Fluviicola sp. TaxID=1917219 RepID=UPI0031D1BD9A
MKRRTISFTAIAVILVTSFAACSKFKNEDSLQSEIKDSKSATKTFSCAPTSGTLPVAITPANEDAVIDAFAALHNDYLNYYFTSLSSQALPFPSNEYDEHFRNTAITYFGEHSVVVDNEYYDCIQSSNPDTDLAEFRSSFSAEGLVIYDQLCNLADHYEVENHDDFVVNLNDLYANCNSVAGTERVTLKFAIKIAINSFTYWKENVEEWVSYYENNYTNSVGVVHEKQMTDKNKQMLVKAGKADLKGAIRGATGGGLGGGPAGAVAGGLVGAGVYSAASIVWSAIFG